MSSVTFTAGLLYYGFIRRELEAAKFRGEIDDFYESSGILDRKFVVKGDPVSIKSVCHWLEKLEGGHENDPQ